MDEELDGDDYWCVAAHDRRGVLSEAGIEALRDEMEGIADRHGGTFDRWDVARGAGLGHAKPGDIPE
jgi:hypothetical protein